MKKSYTLSITQYNYDGLLIHFEIKSCTREKGIEYLKKHFTNHEYPDKNGIYEDTTRYLGYTSVIWINPDKRSIGDKFH